MEKKIIKPILKNEINVKIVSLGEIEDNISEVKDYAKSLASYYENLKFTPETMKEATDEKAQINKFKKKVADFRKGIIKEYNKPIEIFEKTAKETEKILTDTYDTINQQVLDYQNTLKQEIKEKIKDYFEEYRASKNVDEKYLSFEELNINITIDLVTEKGSITKKAKDLIIGSVDKVHKDIETIKTMQYNDEILVEYLKNKDLSISIREVNDRHMILDTIKKSDEEFEKKKTAEEKVIEKVDEVLQAPVEEKKEEKQYAAKFKVFGTLKQIQDLKKYLEKGGYKYEQFK